VDLVPGILVLALLSLLIPKQVLEENLVGAGLLTPALLVLAGGYTIGRVLHGITGWDTVDELGKKLAKPMPKTPVEERHLTFSGRVRHVRSCDTDESSVESEVVDAVLESAVQGTELEAGDILNSDCSEDYEPGCIDDIKYLRYIADSTLYGQQRLSWKYALLATFFRNLWPIFLSFFIIFAFNSPIQSVVPMLPRNGNGVLLFGLLLGFGVSLQQRFKFKRRQIRAIINELYLIWQQDADEDRVVLPGQTKYSSEKQEGK
jgi:hypothetical protein